jgi:hypothetical protein
MFLRWVIAAIEKPSIQNDLLVDDIREDLPVACKLLLLVVRLVHEVITPLS